VKKKDRPLPRVDPEVRKQLIDMSTGLIADPRLTAEELQHCRSLVQEGFHYFSRIGWTPQQEGNFLGRPSVKIEIDRLLGQLQDADGLAQRTTFFARVDLYRMLPAAIAVIAKTLQGYKPGKNAPLDVPTPEQYDAAKDILRWCGLTEGQALQVNITNNSLVLPQLDRAKSGKLDEPGVLSSRYDPNEILRRGRIRATLENILKKTEDTENRILRLEGRRKKKKNRRDDHEP
jgi:hypothetical protein